MGLQDFFTAVSNFGFPVVLSGYLLVIFGKKIDDSTKVTNDLKISIENNTKTTSELKGSIDRLNEKIDEIRFVNKKR